jgi:YfiH family protein
MVMRPLKTLNKMTTNFIIPVFKNIHNISMLQTTRIGGVSLNNYNSMNVSMDVKDNPDHVIENINFLERFCPKIQWINQVHGSNVIELPCSNMSPADAVFTKKIKTVCAIKTADCLPILLTNEKGSFVAAIHAGWRGMGLGVIEKTIRTIDSDSEIFAWLGPSIGVEKFVVGHDVYEFFEKNDPDVLYSFIKHHDKYKLCLPTAAKKKLINIGVKKIFGSTVDDDFCTYNDKERFFSYRRDKITGRMASLIWINN